MRYALLLFLLIPANFASASPNLPKLELGMSPSEVYSAWGSPTEKIEYETSRLERWRYPSGEVMFHQGKLAMVYEANPIAPDEGNLKPMHAEARPERVPWMNRRVDQKISDEVINEVMDSLPNEDPNAPSPPNSLPQVPPLMKDSPVEVAEE